MSQESEPLRAGSPALGTRCRDGPTSVTDRGRGRLGRSHVSGTSGATTTPLLSRSAIASSAKPQLGEDRRSVLAEPSRRAAGRHRLLGEADERVRLAHRAEHGMIERPDRRRWPGSAGGRAGRRGRPPGRPGRRGRRAATTASSVVRSRAQRRGLADRRPGVAHRRPRRWLSRSRRRGRRRGRRLSNCFGRGEGEGDVPVEGRRQPETVADVGTARARARRRCGSSSRPATGRRRRRRACAPRWLRPSPVVGPARTSAALTACAAAHPGELVDDPVADQSAARRPRSAWRAPKPDSAWMTWS